MPKAVHLTAKILLSLLLLMSSTMPIFALLGQIPEPTPDMYTNMQAYEFIRTLMDTRYINMLNSLIFGVSLILLWTRRGALAALLILPITVNITAFHWYLDGGPFTGGAVMGNVLLALNAYFLWVHRKVYEPLIQKHG